MNGRILELENQQTIAIADKPILLGGNIKHIPISEFEMEIGQRYLDRIDASECHIHLSENHENITGNLTSRQLKKQLEFLLKNSRKDLIICKINNDVGYGIFALNDIPKDTVLCFYSGTLINSSKVKIESDHAIEYYGLNASFSTKNYRGIASFFQHLPSKLKFSNAKVFSQILQSMGQSVSESDLKINDELYSIEFHDKKVEKSLATANIRCEYVCYNGIPVTLFVTDSQIKAGEQLGFNYGKDYWLSRNSVPELFNQSGAVIPCSLYKRTFYQLKLDRCTYTGDLLPLIQQLQNGKSQIDIIDEKSKIKKIDASTLLNELLRVRGISEAEYQLFRKNSSLYQANSLLFENTEINYLVKKYNLSGNTQPLLEKGLRNAATNNQVADLKKFIKFVKNIDAQDTNPKVQRTALHWAAVKGHDECCQLLLESGANPNILDAAGEAAMKHLKTSLLNMNMK